MHIQKHVLHNLYETPMGNSAYSICEKIHDAGFTAYFVGGAVRDLLFEMQPSDIDITTDATFETLQRLFSNISHYYDDVGVCILNFGTYSIEVARFRIDSAESNGRKPANVQFGNQTEDAVRRDFTINALYYNPITKEIIDVVGGLADIPERLIRFIGDPTTRIQEDYVRMLRAIRLKNQISGQYEPNTFQALRHNCKYIQQISAYRKREEIEKILLQCQVHTAFNDLWDTGVLEYLLPDVHACKGVAQPRQYHKEGDVWNHTLQAVSALQPDHSLAVRYAILFHDIGKTKTFHVGHERIEFNEHATASAELAGNILSSMLYSANEVQKIVWLIKHHMMMHTFLEISPDRKRHWYFHPYFKELMDVFWLDIAGTTPADFSLYNEVLTDYNTFLNTHPRPPKALLTGEEIMEILHTEPGRKVGECLEKLLDAQIHSHITTKKEAIEYIQKLQTS